MANIILDSLKQSLKLVTRYWYIVILLFVIQISYFLLLSVNLIINLGPALGAIQEVIAYANQLNLSEQAFAENLLTNSSALLGSDPLLIYRNYTAVMQFVSLFILISIILFVILEGLNWVLVVHMHREKKVEKKVKTFIRAMLNFFIISIGYFILIGLIVMLQLKMLVSSPSLPSFIVIISLIILFLLIYFMMVSYSLLYNNNIKVIMKKTFFIGAYKAYILLPVMLFNILLVVGASYLMFSTVELELSLALMLLSVFLFTFSYIFSRIFLVRVVHNLDN